MQNLPAHMTPDQEHRWMLANNYLIYARQMKKFGSDRDGLNAWVHESIDTLRRVQNF